MKCVVTGAAGFIGSHLCEDLLRRGHHVVGVDSFLPTAPAAEKARNQAVVLAHPRYHFAAADLRRDDLTPLVADADLVFHLAGMPGVPHGWADAETFWACNVLGTQRLLDAVRDGADRVRRFVLASSAAVYGPYALGPESAAARPTSAYGVTKLAAEQLCLAFADAEGLPVVTLRYFGVYGPRQRPDMLVNRLARALASGEPVEIYGDGRQVRGGTFVADAVAATVAAADAPTGEVYNVGGPEQATVLDLLSRLEDVAGRKADVVFKPSRPGDQRQAVADTTKIRNHLGWRPATCLDDGLARQWAWQLDTETPHPAPAAKRVAVLT